ncbi:hypothetical protein KEM48_011322 [Puccinia striiformis f. sp. tritici PST-130]|nr:hypothetical protein KEM48_011322 [Puccinia striiformis f. sp. tritici PST-130]
MDLVWGYRGCCGSQARLPHRHHVQQEWHIYLSSVQHSSPYKVDRTTSLKVFLPFPPRCIRYIVSHRPYLRTTSSPPPHSHAL